MIDVARQAGVSRVTVSHVLHGSGANVRVSQRTRDRVLRAARQLNYKPNRSAQQLRGARSGILGVIVDTWNVPVMSVRLSALEHEARERGYRLIIGQSRRNAEQVREYLDDFSSRGTDGVFCLLDLMHGDEEVLHPFFDAEAHLVFHGKPIVEGAGCVRVDTASGVRQSLGHLLDRGQQLPALVLWNLADERAVLRHEAYVAELTARGHSVDPQLIWSPESPSLSPTIEELDLAIHMLVTDRGADALVADDDMWAARLIQRLKNAGYRVPDDVAVVGYDNLDMATVIDPPLTTVDQNHQAYARAALDLIIALCEHGSIPETERTITIEPKLIVRDST